MSDKQKHRIIDIALDTAALAPRSDTSEHERRVAIHDLIENNHFRLTDNTPGPYRLRLSVGDRGVLFHIADADDNPLQVIDISLRPLRRNIRDYFMIGESYFEAVRTGDPMRIEAIDEERRVLHTQSGELLQSALAERAEVDVNTARRLFTLISVLHLHGMG